ncbi:hypothetical protein [Conexibacter sp. DBS9H8]|uniref:hypothetical protein n=1 Tax=Conexibacter sp. DBS9H8 TaxID=2937801 RepID=UPI00200C65AB|nr:hypothetical protein [Conexibacter sp. DBS9H8]
MPLTLALREQSDGGLPVVLSAPEDAAAAALTSAAKRLIAMDTAVLPMASVAAPAKPVGMSLPMV